VGGQNGHGTYEMEYVFFGLQVVVKAIRGDELRIKLHKVMAEASSEQSLADKRTFYKKLVGVLVDAMPVFEKGFWDYLTEDAQEEFDGWCAEIEGTIATEEEEIGRHADETHRLTTDKDYVIVSVMLLLERGSPSDDTLAARCDLEEADYFTRATFAHLLHTLPMLSFQNVQADAIYLVPGNEEDGFSFDDLIGEGYDYLKDLR